MDPLPLHLPRSSPPVSASTPVVAPPAPPAPSGERPPVSVCIELRFYPLTKLEPVLENGQLVGLRIRPFLPRGRKICDVGYLQTSGDNLPPRRSLISYGRTKGTVVVQESE